MTRNAARLLAVLVVGASVALVGASVAHGAADAAKRTPVRAHGSLPFTAAATPSAPAMPTGAALRPARTATPDAPATILASGQNESDPFLLQDRGRYFLYTSSLFDGVALNVPVTSTLDLATWTAPTDAMPSLPPWALDNFFYTWSPDVHRFGATYRLYFTAQVKGSSPEIECIGSASGASAAGPFTPDPDPFICQEGLGGSIDPRVFVDQSGTPWMLWKSDQNIGGSDALTTIWSQQLDAGGTTLLGQAHPILQPDEPWQGTIVEAPDMVEVNGTYLLVYSGNWFNNDHYAIGMARCTTPIGPCQDASSTPFVGSNAQGAGPGESSFYADQHGLWMLYSPQRSTAPAVQLAPRTIGMVRIGIDAFGPYLAAGGPPPSLQVLPTRPVWPTG